MTTYNELGNGNTDEPEEDLSNLFDEEAEEMSKAMDEQLSEPDTITEKDVDILAQAVGTDTRQSRYAPRSGNMINKIMSARAGGTIPQAEIDAVLEEAKTGSRSDNSNNEDGNAPDETVVYGFLPKSKVLRTTPETLFVFDGEPITNLGIGLYELYQRILGIEDLSNQSRRNGNLFVTPHVKENGRTVNGIYLLAVSPKRVITASETGETDYRTLGDRLEKVLEGYRALRGSPASEIVVRDRNGRTANGKKGLNVITHESLADYVESAMYHSLGSERVITFGI
ncbi:MAG: hypothetical protein KKG75_01775 [Nanoarchaeota archaeon]|nr:hypothetical protein [Nanoarchaeota archaeon]